MVRIHLSPPTKKHIARCVFLLLLNENALRKSGVRFCAEKISALKQSRTESAGEKKLKKFKIRQKNRLTFKRSLYYYNACFFDERRLVLGFIVCAGAFLRRCVGGGF